MAVIEMERVVHPQMEKLRALAQGRLAADEVETLEDHLATCDSCCLFLEEAHDDSFMDRLRDARDIPPLDTFLKAETADPSDQGEQPSELAEHPRYRLIRLLGRGGMGAVYLADHRRMGRPVALKVINTELLNQRGALSRFQQEARTAAKLDHPNIVAAYDADQAGDVHFLVMEYVEGQNLADAVKEKGPLTIGQACDIIRQAALGLQHAHERGMVHRDIKPHNLMLTPSGQVKVLDFGLARIAAEPADGIIKEYGSRMTHLTGTGMVMGSADYIAPEQARDSHAADCRSDIYSLGCTLYYLLTKRPPFPDGTAPEKLKSHSAMDPCRLTALRPEVSNGLAKVVAKMMAKRPEDRYQSAAEVAGALTRFAGKAAPKPFLFRKRGLVLVGLLTLAIFSIAAATGVVRLDSGDREIVIETDDPALEVVVKGDRIVRIVDPTTGKAYQLDRNDLTLTLADDPDGLAVVLDGERPINLKRQGKRIATVRLEAKGYYAPPLKLEPASMPPPAVTTSQPSISHAGMAIMPPPTPLFAVPPVAATPADIAAPAYIKVRPERQIAINTITASVDRKEAQHLLARWLDDAKNGQGATTLGSASQRFGIISDGDGFRKDLQALADKKMAHLSEQPKITLLNGRPGYVVSGGETPILTSDVNGTPSVTYKTFGTVTNFLATIPHDGKIQLKISLELSKLNPKADIKVEGDNPSSIPGFDTETVQGTVLLAAGQSVVISGLKDIGRPGKELIFLTTTRIVDPDPQPARQVQLDVIVANVNPKAARHLKTLMKDADAQPPGPPDSEHKIFGGILKDPVHFRKELSALCDKKLAKIVEERQIMTLSGEAGRFVSGGQSPILTTSATGNPNVSYKEFGTVFSFKPEVQKDGRVNLEMRLEFSNMNAAEGITIPAGGGPAIVPGFDTCNFSGLMQLEDGQTLAIAGIMRKSIVAVNATTSREIEEEVVILVTPRVK